MNWLLLLRLLPLITSLMEIAEKVLDGRGEGTKKKAFVKDGLQQTIKTMSEISTGGQKETWQNLDLFWSPISRLIDILAELLFPNKE